MVAAIQHAWCVLTDSGGLQEEAPALGKPVLVLRDVTERPEAVSSGVVRLVGTSRDTVFQALSELNSDRAKYRRMARPVFPYGDGHASKRISIAIRQYLDRTVPLRQPLASQTPLQTADIIPLPRAS
jgi:UDP-N-acetylglucosamine 2-epimerase (non-hydrolysing)